MAQGKVRQPVVYGAVTRETQPSIKSKRSESSIRVASFILGFILFVSVAVQYGIFAVAVSIPLFLRAVYSFCVCKDASGMIEANAMGKFRGRTGGSPLKEEEMICEK
jgi:hypothetical protein